MADPSDMILPMLREMRAEIAGRFRQSSVETSAQFTEVKHRLDAIEAAQKSFRQALTGDSLLSKLVTGEFEQRIEALERKMERLEAKQ